MLARLSPRRSRADKRHCEWDRFCKYLLQRCSYSERGDHPSLENAQREKMVSANANRNSVRSRLIHCHRAIHLLAVERNGTTCEHTCVNWQSWPFDDLLLTSGWTLTQPNINGLLGLYEDYKCMCVVRRDLVESHDPFPLTVCSSISYHFLEIVTGGDLFGLIHTNGALRENHAKGDYNSNCWWSRTVLIHLISLSRHLSAPLGNRGESV